MILGEAKRTAGSGRRVTISVREAIVSVYWETIIITDRTAIEFNKHFERRRRMNLGYYQFKTHKAYDTEDTEYSGQSKRTLCPHLNPR